MGKQASRKLLVYLPVVFIATFLVVLAPLLLVFWLRKSGVVTSVWVGMAAGVLASFLASYAGAAFWKTRTDSRDILFSELMLWGWVQRWRSEQRLNRAADLLGLTTGQPQAIPGGALTNEQKMGLLTQLSSGLEARDPYTHGHSRRVARHAANIAKRMGMPRGEVAKIRAAGAMHDVGKVETPLAVLQKDGKLTDEEYGIIKLHPVDGATMVEMLDDDELTAIVRHHHERLDGTGYPDRLAGDAIPMGARIIAVADTFDAITSTRPYRQASAHKKAIDVLEAEAGTQLDPAAVRAFVACYSGRRPLAYWTVLANGRPRLAAWLGGGASSAKSAAASVMASAGTAAAVGGAAMGPVVEPAPDSRRALANIGAPHAPSGSGKGTQARRRGGVPAHRTTGNEARGRGERGSRQTRLARTVPIARRREQDGSGVPLAQSDSPMPVAPSIPAPIGYKAPDQSSQPTDSKGAGKAKDPAKDNGNAQGKDNGNGAGNPPRIDKIAGNEKAKSNTPTTTGNGKSDGPAKGNDKPSANAKPKGSVPSDNTTAPGNDKPKDPGGKGNGSVPVPADAGGAPGTQPVSITPIAAPPVPSPEPKTGNGQAKPEKGKPAVLAKLAPTF